VRSAALALSSSLLAWTPESCRQFSASAQSLQPVGIVPLFLCGGAYCAAYTIEGQRFRAVLDTGSPFVLVDGTCNSGVGVSPWGCFRGDAQPAGLDDTDELFGGEDVGVEWRRGKFAFEEGEHTGGERAVAAVAMVPDAIFGIVRGYVGKGGGGAVFLGLCKRRLPRIRPTLLEQTDYASLRFDFLKRRLELATQPQIGREADAVRLIDLRLRGAPVFNYACRVASLRVNGQTVVLDRPTVAIIDTGTTGISVDDRLLDALYTPSRTHLPPASRFPP